MKDIVLSTEETTMALGEALGKLSLEKDIFILTGDLGAGKTTFSKGFARGLGIEQMIKSPTYTLIREYQTGRLPLYHMDVYRLAEGASDLGLDDYLDGDGVCLIEWGSLIKEEIDLPYIEITLDKTGDHTRSCHITSHLANRRLDDIKKSLKENGWFHD